MRPVSAVAGGGRATRPTPPPRPRAERGYRRPDGQTRTPHPGRSAPPRRSPPWWPSWPRCSGGTAPRGHDQPPGDHPGAQPGPGPRRPRNPRPTVDGGQPAHAQSGGDRRHRGDRRRPDRAGRDAQTGQNRWTFARDTNLCAVSYIYDLAVAVYPDVRGCGQVSGIDAATGRRGPTCTAYADKHVVVSSNGSAILGRADPPGAVALGSGADDVLRRDRRPGEAGQPGRRHRLHADVGGGQRFRGLGARGLPRPEGSAADAAQARQGGGRAGDQERAAAGRGRRLRGAGDRGVRHHHRGVPAHPATGDGGLRRHRHQGVHHPCGPPRP